MNFQLAKAGQSFRGSMAYYLHDKRAETDAAHPTTSERVAWTETRNLAGVGPHTATRMMIATAQSAAELKAAAGVKATGRKATAGPVFAFSLQWRADELEGVEDRRAEMTRAADHALHVLGLTDRQAVLVAHTDRDHPHVHIILNRVSCDDGRMANIDPNKVRALNRWAGEYERDRGKIVSPNRAAKMEITEEKRRRHPDPEKRRAYVLDRDRRRKAEREGQLAEAKRQAFEKARSAPETAAQRPNPLPRPQSQAAILKDLGDQVKARHKEAWRELAARNKAARDAIFTESAARVREAQRTRKELARPSWAQHFREERTARAVFEARERGLAGIVANALAAAKHQQASGTVPGRGLLSLTFANVLSGTAREAAFTAQQDTRRGEVARQLRAALDADVAAIKTARAGALELQRKAFDTSRADLIAGQDAERAKIREAWQQVYSREGKQPFPRARVAPARVMEAKPVREDYDKARGLAAANPAPHPTDRRHVSAAAPAPSPVGAPPVTARQVQDVPRKPEPIMPAVARSASPPTKDWTKAATPPAPSLPAKDWTRTTSAPAAPRAPVKDWSQNAAEITRPALPAKDWSAQPSPSREIKPLPPRSRDRDRER